MDATRGMRVLGRIASAVVVAWVWGVLVGGAAAGVGGRIGGAGGGGEPERIAATLIQPGLPVEKLVYGGDSAFPPFEFLDSAGQPAGFNVELVRALAREMGVEVEVRLGPWQEIRDGFVGGKIDAVTLFDQPQRHSYAEFCEPHAWGYSYIFVRKGERMFSRLADLEGCTVIVQKGGLAAELFAEHAGVKTIAVESEGQAIALLASGAHDAAVVTHSGGSAAILKGGYSNVVSSGPVLASPVCMSVGKGNVELLRRLNAALAKVRASGEFSAIENRWVSRPPAVETLDRSRVLRWSLWAAGGVLVLAGGVVVWGRSMRGAVKRQTEKLAQSEERYRAFIERSLQAVWRFELAEPVDTSLPAAEQIELFYERGYLAEANDAFANQYGYEHASEMLGARLGELLVREQPANREFLEAFIACGYSLSGAESEEMHRDGSRRFFINSMVGILEKGKLARAWGTQQDVTERKRSQEALDAASHRYRTLFEQSPDGVLLVDPQTRRPVECNASLAELLGSTPEEIAGFSMSDLEAPGSAGGFEARVEATLKSGGDDFESTWRTRGGREIIVRLKSRVVTLGGRQLFQTVVRDITDRTRALDALRASEATTRAILSAVPDMLFRMDRQGRYLWHHAPVPEDLLAPPEKFLGLTPHDVLPAPLAEQCTGHLAELFRTGVPQRYEYTFDRGGGTRYWEVRMVKVSAGDALVVVRNVTEARLAENRARSSESRYRLLWDSSPLGIIFFGPDGTITEWNPGAEEIFGYTADEARGLHFSVIVPENIRPQIDMVWNDIAARRGGERNTNANLTRDGRTIWCEWFNTPLLHDDGRFLGVASLVEDVTREREAKALREGLEEQLRRSQRLESLGVLAGGIAHDFNNLLVGVLGNAELALRQLDASGEPAAAVRTIAVAARRAAELTRQILAYAGRGARVVGVVDLARVARELTDVLGSTALRHARVRVDAPADAIYLTADSAQVSQVVLNLLTNAGEAVGPQGGEVTVRVGTLATSRQDLDRLLLGPEAAPGLFAFVEVEDNGVGMDHQTLARVFEPFFSTKAAGHGLGLAAVLGIVRSHGGAIELHSRRGEGTRIRVLLPASPAGVMELKQEESPAAEHAATARILIVDDEPLVRDLVVQALTQAGFRVDTAADGERAVAAFRRGEFPDLAVIDRTMPGISGDQVLRELESARPEIPAIIMSGYADQAYVDALEAQGERRAFLPKPFSIDQLLAKVRETLRLNAAAHR